MATRTVMREGYRGILSVVDADDTVRAGVRAIASLGPAVVGIEAAEMELADARRAAARGHFTPDEDANVQAWFARYLTARAGLLETIDDLRPITETDINADAETQLRAFVVAYTAACLLVRAGRFLVSSFADHTLIQRKLNEGEPRFRIPRKQYTAIRKSLTDPANGLRLRHAQQFADEHRADIEALGDHSDFAIVLEYLREAESSLRVGVREFVKARLDYRSHSVRRRHASAVQQAFFAITEVFGRVIAEARLQWRTKRITEPTRRQIEALLNPGDVIITRHDDAMSNLFLPGYWPHAALYVGEPGQRQVLEARKDGVLFRTLDDTLAVDATVVIRPNLTARQIARALAQAITHEGKLYDFDFDFFRADRLVCTEVVYRAYDGVGDLHFELTRRTGRLTLSAEDLVKMAVENRGFRPVAVFGATGCPDTVVTGPDVAGFLATGGD
ncbi:MAG: YiiX/YebB-like N1pC/P60 family cysteine hydrolase, partial [Phycisphaerales bacterium]